MKIALVTGGAKGIGSAIVRELVKGGYFVALNYNSSKNEAMKIADEIPNVLPLKADITKPDEVMDMVRVINKTAGEISVLVNNAGIAEQKLFADITSEDFDRMYNVNLKGMFNVCKAVLPDMLHNKYGKIINISSIWGITGASCEVHYSTMKAGIIGFTKALAKELGPSSINVNCVAPGVIETDMNANLSAQTLDALCDETPLCRLGTPSDIAQAVSFLASDNASFITGQVLSPNGGIVI